MTTNTVYVVTSVYSATKEEVDESSVENYVFSSLKKARKVMKNIVKTYYDDLKPYDSDDSDEESRNRSFDARDDRFYEPLDNRFFEARNNSVLFGEDEEFGVGCYRGAWGLVTIKKVKMNTY